MPDLFTSMILGAAAFALFVWISRWWSDAQLDARLAGAYDHARVHLPAHELERLNASLLDMREAGLRAAALHGRSGKQASRMMKAAAIQQIAAFIEIERMFSGENNSAPPAPQTR